MTATIIAPAGMSLARALEIAVECDRRNPFARRPGREKLPQGRRLTATDNAFIVASTDTPAQVAALLGVTERTVERIRAHAAEDLAWKTTQRRRVNRVSFRGMTDEWTEIPC